MKKKIAEFRLSISETDEGFEVYALRMDLRKHCLSTTGVFDMKDYIGRSQAMNLTIEVIRDLIQTSLFPQLPRVKHGNGLTLEVDCKFKDLDIPSFEITAVSSEALNELILNAEQDGSLDGYEKDGPVEFTIFKEGETISVKEQDAEFFTQWFKKTEVEKSSN